MRILSAFFVLAFAILSLPCRSFAEEEAEEPVLVGYYENEVFEEGAAPGAVKTGYAYEYYRKLSEYTGWNYEYVYGSYSDLYEKLLAGEIDLLAGLAKKEDRIGLIGYPDAPMGNEIYSLVKHDDDYDVTTDPKTLTGERIGVLNSAIADALAAYLLENGVEAEVVRFDDYEALFEAFDRNKVCILAAEGDGAYGRAHAEVLCPFGASDYFLTVNIQRPDLLEELNLAQSQLAMEEPNYISSLRSKYYSASVSSRSYSEAEKEWLEEHDTLTVGYLDNYLPYSDMDENGEVTGMVQEILPEMVDKMQLSDLSVRFIGYQKYDDMIRSVNDGTIDAAFPVGGGLYYSEENGIYQSEAVASASTDLVYKGEFNSTSITHFAVNENNRMQYYYIKANFPNARITPYPSIEDCLEAVLSGDVKATTLNGLRANDILKNRRYRGLFLRQLQAVDDRCFGVRIGNEGLLKLLNRGLKILGADYIQKASYRYAGDLYSYTFVDVLRDYLWIFLILVLLVVVVILVFILRDLKRTRTANRMKSDFVSSMSHEIRTPITAILGMNELIRQESKDEAILRYSDNIGRAGESLLGIINEILDFSRIEAGHLEINPAPYRIADLLEEQRVLIMQRAKEKGLLFSMEVDENLPSEPIGDRQRISQILANLLTNAVKYTTEGSVKLKVSLVSGVRENFLATFTVEDTGIGIRKEEMKKLYSAFDRLDLEHTGTIEGSGLGLTIAEKMLSAMGSRIEVKSVYGKGSEFSFTLLQEVSDPTPIGSLEEQEKRREEEREKRRDPSFTAPEARILIVDDTPMNLQVVSGLLKLNQLQIDTAESGPDCIRLFELKEYDLMILDLRMPNMNGTETLAELRRRNPSKLKKIPVICFTANVLSGAKDQALTSGFTDYLSKPVRRAELEEVLKK